MSEENAKKEVITELAKDVYNDGGKEVIKPTGKLLALVPRAIKAALLPLEKWVLGREYNLAETEKLLAQKLENIPEENIVTPEPYIAVPAIQYISYAMDSEELRNMYANLLANSMNNVVKNDVHPGFVEIIKQLSPDEAKILHYFSKNPRIPTLEIIAYITDDSFRILDKSFSLVGISAGCEETININKYFDNLDRLGLVRYNTENKLYDDDNYKPLKEHPYVISKTNKSFLSENGFIKCDLLERLIELTSFGEAFCAICINYGENK